MVDNLLRSVEALRVSTQASLDRPKQARLGQFFTPWQAAALMAAMPRLPDTGRSIRILDPGAGSGMLMAAIVARIVDESPGTTVHATAVEVDQSVTPALKATAALCGEWASARGASVTVDVRCEDLIYAMTGLDAANHDPFDLVIMNPPYAKLAADSGHRRALAELGVECPNLYATFLALGVLSLRPGGQLVAITPRSFANGPYFERFRRFLLDAVALDALHVFDSRSTIFSDGGVLQENIVISGTKNGEQGKVRVTRSQGHLDEPAEYLLDYSDLVQHGDPYRFLRIPTRNLAGTEAMLTASCTLTDLGLSVSTGRIVAFRVRDNLREELVETCVPLVYPGNLRSGRVEWPKRIRKAQAFAVLSDDDRKGLLPAGCYVLVKRFSAKEERRRLVAAVWDPELNGASEVAFENHLNVLHQAGGGLDRQVARGLCLWLNSTIVDEYFRTFSGHTQVNATDLRMLRFPPLDILKRLGHESLNELPGQTDLDLIIECAITDARSR